MMVEFLKSYRFFGFVFLHFYFHVGGLYANSLLFESRYLCYITSIATVVFRGLGICTLLGPRHSAVV